MRRSGRPRPIHDRKSPVMKYLDRKSPVGKTQSNVWANARKTLGLPPAIPKVAADCSPINSKPVCFSSDIHKAADEIFVPIPVYSVSPLITPYSTPPRKLNRSEEDPCPLSGSSRQLDNQKEVSSDSSFPVVRRLHFETDLSTRPQSLSDPPLPLENPVNFGCSVDFSSKSLLAEDKSVQQAIQMKSDIMIRILNKTWSIEEKNSRVDEILRLLIDTQKELATRMQSEYEILSRSNYVDAQKLFTMYSKLLSYIMAEINLYENI